MLNVLTRLALPLLLLSACVAPSTAARSPETPSEARGAVSSADPRASEAGREILRAGGSAADAAIAMMLALTVVEPPSSGIGGGGFFVHPDDEDREIETYDGRETDPAAATPTYFFENGEPMSHSAGVPGGKSVGVPGNLRMMALVHEEQGKPPWARLFEHANRLDSEGLADKPRRKHELTDRESDV